ncbi:MAG TPA: glutathione S-transferase family protein [Gaiellaceae bacterium]|jgi:glutathione S-transferase|nr:glutathione S-transferase family protein [Gaiellaceae bacterium]
MLTLYDADRCPYCARVRIVLTEKGIERETVSVDLDDRPAWIYEKNPLGRVPVIEEDGLVLPESVVIMEYLEERYPEPRLWPEDAAERALARLLVERFYRLGDPYYKVRRGDESARGDLEQRLGELDALLEERPFLTGSAYGLADVAYLPWIVRIDHSGFPAVADWVERLAHRPPIAHELELVSWTSSSRS